MKKGVLFFIITVFIISCNNSSKVFRTMNCKKTSFKNLEIIKDVHQKFIVKFPNNWKTNLYYDSNQSSIFSADTTKQLTETYLVDVTMIHSELKLNSKFFTQYKNQLTLDKLIESNSLETIFLEKQTHYSRVIGIKNGLPYQMINLFIPLNKSSHIHAKAEVYGDSLTNERLCNAISLLEKITIIEDD